MRYSQIIIVGAGFFGATIAERLASTLELPVIIVEKRSHIGGNSFSDICPQTGIEYHKYGSHIFHTSSDEVWNYMQSFTKFNTYQHKVFTSYKNRVYTMPINLETINAYYGLNLKPYQVEAFLQNEKRHIETPQSLEEKAISLIGEKLYRAFIEGYTHKQWEKSPKELSPDIITRLPVRYSYNNRYFSDTYEGIPLDGYYKVFERMLSHPRICVYLNTSYKDFLQSRAKDTFVIYTGAIDEYFNYSLGKLEWRTLDFNFEVKDMEDWQGTAVMNYAEKEIPFTRVHEYKHYHPERIHTSQTLIAYEYSRFAREHEDPYYPINTQRNTMLFQEYVSLAEQEKNVLFGGRLGQYKYLDMDKTIYEALKLVEKLKHILIKQ